MIFSDFFIHCSRIGFGSTRSGSSPPPVKCSRLFPRVPFQHGEADRRTHTFEKIIIFLPQNYKNALFFHFFAKKFGKRQMFIVSLHSRSKSSPSIAARRCGCEGAKIWQNFNLPPTKPPLDELRTGSKQPLHSLHSGISIKFRPRYTSPHHGQVIFEIRYRCALFSGLTR